MENIVVRYAKNSDYDRVEVLSAMQMCCSITVVYHSSICHCFFSEIANLQVISKKEIRFISFINNLFIFAYLNRSDIINKHNIQN